MFKRQVEEWESYPEEIQDQLKVYITDDTSREKPLSKVLRFPERIEGHAYQITRKVKWNWIAGRNIGAFHADTKWLLLTDIDHVVTKHSIIRIMNILDKLDTSGFYFFTRIGADGSEIKNHTNSYLITKELFWKIGGYDENLSGLFYGTLGEYHRRAFNRAIYHPVLDIPLMSFSNKEISDSNNSTTFVRNKKEDDFKLRRIQKDFLGSVKVMSFPYIKLNA